MLNIIRSRIVAWTILSLVALVSTASTSDPDRNTVESTGTITEMVMIPGGKFLMGAESPANNSPVHDVYVDTFYIDKYEVTNKQYFIFCIETGRDLPEFWGIDRFRCGADFPDHPILGVSWAGAKAYAEWCGKRLPTEAEWEYAARGGLVGKKFTWDGDLDTTKARYYFSEGPVAVGSYPPNGFGLYDMVGNIAEWVEDYYDENYYSVSPDSNPKGPESGSFHVIRGGGWHSGPGCVMTYRRQALPAYWVDFNTGFRCARDYPLEADSSSMQ